MGWFSKKEKVPEVQRAQKSFSPVPDFPRTDNLQNMEMKEISASFENEGLNQDTLKSEVFREEDNNNYSSFKQDSSKDFPTKNNLNPGSILPTKTEIFKPIPDLKIKPEIINFGDNQKRKDYVDSNEPIFIRLDKFQSAQKNLENIKDKISEIEFTLKSIKDVKSREEEELSKWSKETENLKLLLSEIDEDIFGKL